MNTDAIPDEMPDDAAITGLRNILRGAVLRPGDAEYDSVRGVWNGMIDRRPGIIVRCQGVADVIAAVNFARGHGLLVAVRGGGHSVAGHAVCDGGLMIDLSAMRAVRVDPIARRAWVQGGATWGDVDCETTAFGLATPGGLISTTGVGGLTLSGGVGWLRGTAGLCVDNLTSADVVTADGQMLHASAMENPDLFWAIRGGGGNFGIVVGFEFRLQPVEQTLMFCAAVYPETRAAELLPLWRDFMTNAPRQISSLAEFSTIPDDPEYPAHTRGVRVLALAAVYDGPADKGEAATAPLRSFGKPLLDFSAKLPYRTIQSMYDPLYPKGRDRSYFRSLYLPELSPQLIGEIVAGVALRPSEMNYCSIWYFGDVVRGVAASATAFGDRSQPWLLSIDAIWSKPADDATNIAWVRRFWSTVRPYSNGRLYLNFMSGDEADTGSVRASVGAETYARLALIKAKYDPDNFFRLNQNITPG